MSKRTGNRNAREAKKRRARHRRRSTLSWRRLHVVIDGVVYRADWQAMFQVDRTDITKRAIWLGIGGDGASGLNVLGVDELRDYYDGRGR